MVPDARADCARNAQQHANRRSRKPQPREPLGDERQVPDAAAQVVVDGAGDATRQQVHVDGALAPLPTGGKARGVLQFFPQPAELVVQGQAGIQAPVVPGVKAGFGGISVSGGVSFGLDAGSPGGEDCAVLSQRRDVTPHARGGWGGS